MTQQITINDEIFLYSHLNDFGTWFSVDSKIKKFKNENKL